MSRHSVLRRTSSCCAIERSPAVEDYLRAVFKRSGRGEATTTSALAAHLGVAAPSVSAMLHRLAANDLIDRSGEHHVRLTDHGRRHALEVVRRHRLVEAFLADVLGLPWDEVDAEADVLEHAVSDRLLDRIDAHLGHPTRDPHGDPIPPRTGEHDETWAGQLSAAEPGERFLVERVCDRDSDALRYLGDIGIRPGALLDVTERAPFDGPLWVRAGQRDVALGPALAGLVHGRRA